MFLQVSEKEAWNLSHCEKIEAIDVVNFDDSNLDPNAKTLQLTEDELKTIQRAEKYKPPTYLIVFIYSEKKGKEDMHFVTFSDKKSRDTAFNNLMTDMKTKRITKLTPRPRNIMQRGNSLLKEYQHLLKIFG